MQIVIFGATGFIGGHITEQLKLAGHDIICVVRQQSNIEFLNRLAVRVVEVDFSDQKKIGRIIPAGSVVCNCIADTRMHLSEQMRRGVEVELTSQLLRTAQAAKAKRFIQLSTVMVYGFDRPPTAINESYSPNYSVYSYCRIAQEREQILLRLAKESLTELVLLRPTNTIGQRDTSFLPNFLNSHRQGFFPVVSGGHWRFSCIDTRDIGRAVVHLIALAIRSPEIFLVKGYDTDWLELKAQLDTVLNKKSRLVNMPKRPMLLIGRIMEMIYQYGAQPPLTRFGIEVLSNNTLYADAKLRATGFVPKYNLAETLRDATNGL